MRTSSRNLRAMSVIPVTTQAGTAAWIAPEIIEGKLFSEMVDVFSFGVVMWELLTRKIPFKGQDDTLVMGMVGAGIRPEVPKECPPLYRLLLERCWNQEDTRRPQMSEILDELNRIAKEIKPQPRSQRSDPNLLKEKDKDTNT